MLFLSGPKCRARAKVYHSVVACFLFFTILFCAPLANAGTLNGPGSGVGYRQGKFSGEIVSGDEIALRKEAEFLSGLDVSSSGGNIEVALQMARIIRRERMNVVVPKGATCESACVLLLAGAVSRHVQGEVWIHRPYFVAVDPSLSEEQLKQRYQALVREIGSFFEEMNVPTTLLDVMISIPPEERKKLSTKELTAYMLNQRDPVYDERLTASEAQKFLLTSQEYRRRSLDVKKKCYTPEFYASVGKFDRVSGRVLNESEVVFEEDACEASVMTKLPIGVVRERQRRYEKILSYNADISAKFDACFSSSLKSGDFSGNSEDCYSGKKKDDSYACYAAIMVDGIADCDVGSMTSWTATRKSPLDAADYASGAEDYNLAAQIWLPLAVEGNPRAQTSVGYLCKEQEGPFKDKKPTSECVDWFLKAANQNYPDAERALGSIFSVGELVPKDYSQAVRWYRRAADHGSRSAMISLGNAYATGNLGFEPNYAEALRWYLMAAEGNDREASYAQYRLGVLYSLGSRKQDEINSSKWWRYFFPSTRSVPPDLVQAYKWFRIAATFQRSPGYDGMGRQAYSLTKRMSQKEIEQAEALVQEWRRQHR